MKSAKITTTIILVSAIVLVTNILLKKYNLRLDFTEDKQYTLSEATENILTNLDEPVTIKAYFSKDLPANIMKTKVDFNDILIEYSNISDGMVVYEFISPNEDPEVEQKAMQDGIQPIMINVREKDQVKQQKAYMGAIVELGEKKEVIPFIQPGAAMEYSLSTSIKKLAVMDKPSVGLIQGHGEPSIGELYEVNKELSVLYNFSPINMNDESEIPSKYKTLVVIRPKDSIPQNHLAQFDRFLANGGNILFALNKVEGDFSRAYGYSESVGMEDWFANKGITIVDNFVIDINCGSVSVQQQQGPFRFNTNVSFPYLPVVNNFADHPVTKGLEAVMFSLASPLIFTGDSTIKFTPIALSSEKSGSLKAPLHFDVQKDWQETDFPMENLPIAGVFEGKLSGDNYSKMIVIGDGDFAINGSNERPQQLQKDNVNLMVNSIDWLTDETGLIDLRTKGITSRPIKDLEDGKKAFIKWLNFFLPIVLVLIYGIFRMQANRIKKIKRMEVRYE